MAMKQLWHPHGSDSRKTGDGQEGVVVKSCVRKAYAACGLGGRMWPQSAAGKADKAKHTSRAWARHAADLGAFASEWAMHQSQAISARWWAGASQSAGRRCLAWGGRALGCLSSPVAVLGTPHRCPRGWPSTWRRACQNPSAQPHGPRLVRTPARDV
jgi:hypothetical protein